MLYHQIACLSIYCSSMDCQFSFKFKQLVWSYFCFLWHRSEHLVGLALQGHLLVSHFPMQLHVIASSITEAMGSVSAHHILDPRLIIACWFPISSCTITFWIPVSAHHILNPCLSSSHSGSPSPLITFWFSVSSHHILNPCLSSSHSGSPSPPSGFSSHLNIFCLVSSHIICWLPVSSHHNLAAPLISSHSGSSISSHHILAPYLLSSQPGSPSHLITFSLWFLHLLSSHTGSPSDPSPIITVWLHVSSHHILAPCLISSYSVSPSPLITFWRVNLSPIITFWPPVPSLLYILVHLLDSFDTFWLSISSHQILAPLLFSSHSSISSHHFLVPPSPFIIFLFLHLLSSHFSSSISSYHAHFGSSISFHPILVPSSPLIMYIMVPPSPSSHYGSLFLLITFCFLSSQGSHALRILVTYCRSVMTWTSWWTETKSPTKSKSSHYGSPSPLISHHILVPPSLASDLNWKDQENVTYPHITRKDRDKLKVTGL